MPQLISLVLPQNPRWLSSPAPISAHMHKCHGLHFGIWLAIVIRPTRQAQYFLPQDSLHLSTTHHSFLLGSGSLLGGVTAELLLGLRLDGALGLEDGGGTGNGGLTEVGAVTSPGDVVGNVLVGPEAEKSWLVPLLFGESRQTRWLREWASCIRTCGCGHRTGPCGGSSEAGEQTWPSWSGRRGPSRCRCRYRRPCR